MYIIYILAQSSIFWLLDMKNDTFYIANNVALYVTDINCDYKLRSLLQEQQKLFYVAQSQSKW